MGSEKPRLASSPPKRMDWDQFFLGVMYDNDGRRYFGAISPAPYGVPMLFVLTLLIGLAIGLWIG